ncbi:hypothetical protein N7491_005603 [Penicillium cf. griseofulvum]|uniref:Nephrocystin 3-like N-terminal domain-containing protein n=1 Tax=Penicillium cf. griseofulvum TaxID=2972120 RepID=A0A9W9J2Q6_9EURO|nr:hypothetical protein N7472_008289 [Penicillium cf. griseofulvum]KAJ5435008.1 hypothetical protein N7491_005603 [Penicillium cf. griseofulvum]KAJ5452842.1 hypothetical protein N7445_001025 [Penicillium cf. griseofulvum]
MIKSLGVLGILNPKHGGVQTQPEGVTVAKQAEIGNTWKPPIYYIFLTRVHCAIDTTAKKCCDALFLTNPLIDRERLKSFKGSPVEGTGKWIELHEIYQSWRERDNAVFCITGAPGTGKTMLSIYLTELLEQNTKHYRNEDVIYFFCLWGEPERNNVCSILRGLLYQILTKRPELGPYVWPNFDGDAIAKMTLDTPEGLWLIFQTLMKDHYLGKLFCVLDGLDECGDNASAFLLPKFKDLLKSQRLTNLKLAIVSRPLPALSLIPAINLNHGEQVNQDVKTFIRSKMDDLCCIHNFDLKTRENIENHLLRNAEGSFLWVGFVVNEMMTLETHTEILHTMKRIPRGLPEMYGRMLAQIKRKHRKLVPLVVILLRWLAISTKSLSPMELLAVLGRDKIVTGLETIQDLIKMCGGFIRIHRNDKYGRSGRIRLVHQSAKEYLVTISDPDFKEFWFTEEFAHFDIASRCLECLKSIPDLEYTTANILSDSPKWTSSLYLTRFPRRDPRKFSPTIQNFRPEQVELVCYTFMYWYKHARDCGKHGRAMFRHNPAFFAADDSTLGLFWRFIGFDFSPPKGVEGSELKAKPKIQNRTFEIHVASVIGNIPWLESIIEESSDPSQLVNSVDYFNMTPLQYAVSYSQKKVIDILKHHATDRANYARAIWIATTIGHKAHTRMLIDHVSNLDGFDTHVETDEDLIARLLWWADKKKKRSEANSTTSLLETIGKHYFQLVQALLGE